MGRTRKILRYLPLALVAGVGLAFAVWFLARPTPPLPGRDVYERIAAEPEYGLAPTIAALLHEGRAGINNGYLWRIYGVDAPPEDVLAFYLAAVQRFGMEKAGGGIFVPTQDEDFACAWRRDGFLMRLAFMDQKRYRRNRPADREFQTVIQLAWIETDVPAGVRPCSKLLPGDPSPPPLIVPTVPAT